MNVPSLSRAAVVGELTSIASDVLGAGYQISDDLRGANVSRLGSLLEQAFAADTSGLRTPGGSLIEGLQQAHQGLDEFGRTGGMLSFDGFVDGVAMALRGAVDLA
jgi:hypothetical protein